MCGTLFFTRSMMHFNGCMHTCLGQIIRTTITYAICIFMKVFTLSSPLGVSNWPLLLLSDTHITGRYSMSLCYMTCNEHVYSCFHIPKHIFVFSLSFSHSFLDYHYGMDWIQASSKTRHILVVALVPSIRSSNEVQNVLLLLLLLRSYVALLHWKDSTGDLSEQSGGISITFRGTTELNDHQRIGLIPYVGCRQEEKRLKFLNIAIASVLDLNGNLK